MASKTGAVWAIDIGNNSLKALHLSAGSSGVEVLGFAYIQHGKILSGSGVKPAERDELIALSLRQFVKQNVLGKDDVVVSMPSQNSFARFVNLPPVEPKRIPEIVRFEAAQQIPFDVGDVQWDWQLMTEAGSTERKVGIFAIKNDVVNSALEHFTRENIQVTYVQIAPMALYNYVLYDRPDLGGTGNQAVIVLDVGTENTDLVVCTGTTAWQRSVPIGGNAFTKAIAETFKLNFEKAEKLKRTAPMSKYARQIFQAMRPVFTDLAGEIQRSLSFYTSSNPNTKFSRVIALGGGTRMRGLLKYLQQTIQIPVERPDLFKRLTMGTNVSAAKFHESVCDFGVVYGLALQGLGLAKIASNLLPRSIARSMAWTSKAKYFVAAACMLLLVSVLSLGRAIIDRANYKNNVGQRQKIKAILEDVKGAGRKLDAEKSKSTAFNAVMEQEFERFKYRNVVPLLHQAIFKALPNEQNNPEQEQLYRAFSEGDVETVLETPRKQRKQMFITGMSVYFTEDVGTALFGATDMRRASRKRTKRTATMMTAEEIALEMGVQPGMQYQKYSPKASAGKKSEAAKKGDVETGPGFVVTISGYSPYKSIGQLLDPPGVESDKDKWGVITRLMHLDEIFDGNSPFKLYGKTEIRHFSLETGEVSRGANMPMGIGMEEVRKSSYGGEENVLIDPMTKEVISKVAEVDEYGRQKVDRSGNIVYELNDHWFVLNVKFVWTDAPKDSG